MESENKEQSDAAHKAASPARVYHLKPFASKPAITRPQADIGPGRGGPPGPPAPALIHLNSNSGIEPSVPRENADGDAAHPMAGTLETLPARLRKKIYALRERIQWMAEKYGADHIGLLTLTIQENVTDGREFNRRFKSISTNVFPRMFDAWIRVYERQQRGAWHVHVVVATKPDIRTGSNANALNQLIRAKNERKISKAIYYAGLQKHASPTLRGIWKEFRRLCGLREFKQRRGRKRYYKFDSNNLLPIISTPAGLAAYVSKYLDKHFANRRPEDKGMRLVGCSKEVSQACGENFAWAEGAGSVWRKKLGMLGGLLNFASMDVFKQQLGKHWAYHIRPAVEVLMLPYYADMKMAKADGWDLVNTSDGSPWPWGDFEPPKEQVQHARRQALVVAHHLIAKRRSGWRYQNKGRDSYDARKRRMFKSAPKAPRMRQNEFEGLDGPDLSHIVKD